MDFHPLRCAPRFLALICLLFAALPPQAAAQAHAVRWAPSIEVARGNGERGPWQQNDSRYDYVDDGSVALDAHGEAAVVWVDQARKEVLFQRYRADGKPLLSTAVPVSRSPQEFSWLPRVALHPASGRQVYVVWQDIIFSGGSHGGDILFAVSQDGGASFSVPRNLSSSITGAGKGRITRQNWHNGSYDLAVAPDGSVLVAWTEFEGRLMFARSTDGGASFSAPRYIAGNDDQPARGPALAAGVQGRVYLAWTVGETDSADIRVMRSDDHGDSFGMPLIAARTGTYSDAPKLALDRTGVLHLAYANSGAGPFDRFRIHYTRSTDGARSFQAPHDISTPVPEGAIGAHFPHLALDAGGNPVVMWELQTQRQARPRGLGMALSRDGGHSFQPPMPVPHSADAQGGTNGSHQGLLMRKLDVNGNHLAIVNSALRDNQGSRVWLLRGRLAPD